MNTQKCTCQRREHAHLFVALQDAKNEGCPKEWLQMILMGHGFSPTVSLITADAL